jgi:uncharacterized protein YndB with AHSA1/START domain
MMTTTLETAPRELVLAREFDAPRELVWRAWTVPEHVARWWGPQTFTATCELDLRVGGSYRIVMRGPDGEEGPLTGEFLEITPPERLVMTMDLSEESEEWFDVVFPDRDKSRGKPELKLVQTVTFEAVGNKTRLTVRQRLESDAVRDAFLRVGAVEGWESSFEKLDDLLAAL